MDRETIEKAAIEFQSHVIALHNPALVKLERQRLVDFALSLFQWKDVAEGLPEVSGLYVVSVKARGLMITGFASDSDSDKWRWEEKYDRYIPYPIPPYEKKEQK